MEELLYPERRISKMFITSDEIIVDVAPKIEHRRDRDRRAQYAVFRRDFRRCS